MYVGPAGHTFKPFLPPPHSLYFALCLWSVSISPSLYVIFTTLLAHMETGTQRSLITCPRWLNQKWLPSFGLCARRPGSVPWTHLLTRVFLTSTYLEHPDTKSKLCWRDQCAPGSAILNVVLFLRLKLWSYQQGKSQKLSESRGSQEIQ